jgi:AcrR family transcriptional regulator
VDAVVRDPEATKRRLLAAATVEFAAYGIAGARVDRIAGAAEANKALIYHYFESKDALFDAVFNATCIRGLDQNPIDVNDLPGYAGRVFGIYEDHPEVARLLTWYRLERSDSQEPSGLILDSLRNKAAEIARAQKAGILSSTYTSVELLGLILHTAEIWSAITPEFAALVGKKSRAARCRLVVDVVERLLQK